MRKPSRAASFTSDTVTSFWKSTNALPRLFSTCHTGLAVPLSLSALAAGPLEAVKPQSVAAVAPAAWPSARHAPRPNEPAAAPATLMPGGNAPGTSAASASLHCGLPLRWVVRWRLGFQPPDTATRSQANRSVLPLSVPDLDAGDGLASAHALDRTARQIARLCPLGSVLGARRAALPGVDHRGDRDAGIGEVDRRCGTASSLSAKITARLPGATP